MPDRYQPVKASCAGRQDFFGNGLRQFLEQWQILMLWLDIPDLQIGCDFSFLDKPCDRFFLASQGVDQLRGKRLSSCKYTAVRQFQHFLARKMAALGYHAYKN